MIESKTTNLEEISLCVPPIPTYLIAAQNGEGIPLCSIPLQRLYNIANKWKRNFIEEAGYKMTDNQQTTELSKHDWKVIETCLRLRQKELALRKRAAEDYRIFDIQRVLGKIHEQA